MAITPTASILILGLPEPSFAGIDLLSFTTTHRFQGIRNLPPGAHFIFTSASNDESIRHGVWFRVQEAAAPESPQLFIKKWNAQKEELEDEEDQTQKLKWKANLGSIWKEGLTPYRQRITSATRGNTENDFVEESHDFASLTQYISDTLLSRITGGHRNHWSLTSASSANRDVDDIPGISKSEYQSERELRFLPVELKQTWRDGATGRERTEMAQDRSWALDHLIETSIGSEGGPGEDEILGELQFCFLMVLTLNNYSCLEQWKRLLGLLLTCDRAVLERLRLFVRLLQLIKLQLQHCEDVEGGLFDLSDEGGSLLRQLMRRFRQSLERQPGSVSKTDVMDELEELETFLQNEHGWHVGDSRVVRRGMLELEDGEQVEMDLGGYDEEDESGEYAPTVVELTVEQRGALGGDASEQIGSKHEVEEREMSGSKEAEDSNGDPASTSPVTREELDDEEEADLEELDARY